MERINFENTSILKKPYVIVDNTEYELQDGTYDGGTDLNADTFNTLQDNIEEEFSNTKSELQDNLVNIGKTIDNNFRTNIKFNKELFDINNVNSLNAYITNEGVIVSDASCKIVYIPCKSNTTYIAKKIVSARFRIATYDETPNINSTATNAIADNDASSLIITSGANDSYLAIWLYYSLNDTLSYQEIIETLQIQEGNEIINSGIYVDGQEICTQKNQNIYSTAEIIIGEYLGKPLYRKVCYVSELPSTPNTTQKYDVNIRNADFVVNCYGSCSNGNWINASRCDDSTACIGCWYDTTMQRLTITVGKDRHTLSAHVTVEYTKSTD